MASDYYHREFGRHSGIPECCINFFIEVWTTHVPVLHYYQQKFAHLNIDYIPCPNCLVNKSFVQIHKCDKACVKYRKLLQGDVRSEYEV